VDQRFTIGDELSTKRSIDDSHWNIIILERARPYE